jgi:hypothetical protein
MAGLLPCRIVSIISGGRHVWEHKSKEAEVQSHTSYQDHDILDVPGRQGSVMKSPIYPAVAPSYVLCAACGWLLHGETKVKSVLNCILTIVLTILGPGPSSVVWANAEAVSLCGHLSPFSDAITKYLGLSYL